MQQEVQEQFGTIGFESVPATGEILPFPQEQSAQGQTIQVLLIGQFARRKAVQLAQSLLAALFAAELPLDRHPIQLAFAVLEPGVGGGHGGVLQETLEVPIQQPFKAGR